MFIDLQGYIIAHKLMIHRKTLSGLDIDLFTNISIKTIYNMVTDFKTHRCALDFDSIFLVLFGKIK